MHELFLCVVASVDFRNSAEPGVRAENEIGAGGSPPWFTGFAVTALERLMLFRERFPLRAHVEQVHEEIMLQDRGAYFNSDKSPNLISFFALSVKLSQHRLPENYINRT